MRKMVHLVNISQFKLRSIGYWEIGKWIAAQTHNIDVVQEQTDLSLANKKPFLFVFVDSNVAINSTFLT